MYNYPINLNLDTQTETEIDKLYNHEIKAKRVKKEISHLNELHLDNVNVEQVRYSSIGIRIPVDTFINEGNIRKKRQTLALRSSYRQGVSFHEAPAALP